MVAVKMAARGMARLLGDVVGAALSCRHGECRAAIR
jgi:hypothetical protein